MKKLIFIVLTAIVCSVFSVIVPAGAQKNKEHLYGVWLSSVKNLDYPSKPGLSKAQLARELDEVVNTCADTGINAIFFQVRPNADALYKSDIFPWSEVLSGTQGIAPDGNFDSLKYLIQKAHAQNIQVHAWVNPYRIGKSDGDTQKILDSLSADNPAVKNPQYSVVCSDGGVYFNPAIPEVRKLIVSGVEEIVRNYDVDGIHFDDYFYPYGVTDYPDSEQFETYGAGFDNIADFRRNNVNLLIKDAYTAIHKIKKTVKFGVSPFGIWCNEKDNPQGSKTSGMSSYKTIYSDSKAWVENKWVDYICPQLYWAFETKAAPFDKLVDWWSTLCQKSGAQLYVGHALYKLGTDEAGFSSSDQIKRQLDYCEQKNVSGNVFFRYATIKNNTMGCYDILTARLTGNVTQDESFSQNSHKYTPTQAYTQSSISITSPQNASKTTDSTISITGVGDPALKLSVNGKTVDMTQHGYFSVFVSLEMGANKFVFKNGSSSATVTVNRTAPVTQDLRVNKYFKKDSATPSSDSIYYSSERIELSVYALDGTDIFAEFCGTEIQLENKGTDDKGFCRFSAFADAPYIMCGQYNCGEVEFYAKVNGEKISYGTRAKVQITGAPLNLYTVNESYVYNNIGGGSMMDNYQLPVATNITATGLVNGYYRLQSGKWINQTNVAAQKPETPQPDINLDKYSRIDLQFDSVPDFQSCVNEAGTLIIDLFGAVHEPTIALESAYVNVMFVQRGANVTAVFSSQSGTIDGFYVSKTGDNILSVWVYSNRSGGIAGKKIVIDPGHGGTDRGALGPAGGEGICEDDLNLSISYLLAQKLKDLGADIVLSRTDNSDLPLAARPELIRSYNPDLCISVHNNSVSASSDYNTATGTLTLYSRNTALSLCKAISPNISNGLGVADTGIKMQSLNVCREYRFPCILVECGFVCNPVEYEKLLTEEYKNTLVNNIVLSICDYFQ